MWGGELRRREVSAAEEELYFLRMTCNPPLECIVLPYPVFEAVGYGEIQQRDTARVQLDTARYVVIQLDTVGYSGIQWICRKTWLDIGRYRDTAGYTKDTVRVNPL